MLHLQKPLQIKSMTLHNRLIMPPMQTGKIGDSGIPAEVDFAYYDEKSRGGRLSLIITEHCFISEQGRANRTQLSVASDEVIPALTKLVEAIHANGTKAVAQLNHAGGATTDEATRVGTVSPSGIGIRNGEGGDALDQAGIDQIAADFAAAAVRAKKAGYDGVEIHSAHRYLLNQFYTPVLNKREDAYGGDVEGRTKIHRDVIAAVRKAVGDDYPIFVRLGAVDYTEGGNELADALEAAKILEAAGADVLDISGGLCSYIAPGREQEQGYFSDITAAIRQVVDIPVILTGGVTDIEAAERLLAGGAADMIGVGRAIFKDSGWAERGWARILNK